MAVGQIGWRGLLPAREEKRREEKVGKAAWVVDWVRFAFLGWPAAGIGFVSYFLVVGVVAARGIGFVSHNLGLGGVVRGS